LGILGALTNNTIPIPIMGSNAGYELTLTSAIAKPVARLRNRTWTNREVVKINCLTLCGVIL